MVDPKTVTFDELEKQFSYILHRYSNWKIPGFDRDDLMQELRIVLWKCQKSYVPGTTRPGQLKPAAFKTFLTRAINKKHGKLQHRYNWTQKRGAVLVSDENGERYIKHVDDVSLEDADCFDSSGKLDEVECVASLSGKTRAIAKFALQGRVKKRDWAAVGVTKKELNQARKEIMSVLKS